MPKFRLSDDQLSEVINLIVGEITVEEGRFAMGVDRPISWNELKEGFPPAYTRHVGEQAWMHLYREAMA